MTISRASTMLATCDWTSRGVAVRWNRTRKQILSSTNQEENKIIEVAVRAIG